MSALGSAKRMLVSVNAWLNAAPSDKPPDLTDFRESQERLYEQAANVEKHCTDELARLTARLRATTMELQSKLSKVGRK